MELPLPKYNIFGVFFRVYKHFLQKTDIYLKNNTEDISSIEQFLNQLTKEQLVELLESDWKGWGKLNQRQRDILRMVVAYGMSVYPAKKSERGFQLIFLHGCWLGDIELVSEIFKRASDDDCKKWLLGPYQKTSQRSKSNQGFMSSLTYACLSGNENTVNFLKNRLDEYDLHMFSELVELKSDADWSCLHYACLSNNSKSISTLILNVDNTVKTDLVFHRGKDGNTCLHIAFAKSHTECAKELLKHLNSNTQHKLLSMKNYEQKDPFQYWHNSIHDIEILSSGHLKNLDLEEKRILPMILAKKNKFGKSGYDYSQHIKTNLEVLDACNEGRKKGVLFSDYFHPFCIQDSSSDKAHDVLSSSVCKKGKATTKPFSSHPLIAIGDSGSIELIMHPYIQIFLHLSWQRFQYFFYANVLVYFLFFALLNVFVANHYFNASSLNTSLESPGSSELFESPLKFSARMPIITEISRYSVIFLAIISIIFEIWQFAKMHSHYWKMPENYLDIGIFISALLLTSVSLHQGYGVILHLSGLVLIIFSAIRGAWMLKHIRVPYLHVGDNFRLLLDVVVVVCKFLPVIFFFVATFALVFHGLLRNQDNFSHVGFAMVKIVTMSIGEFEFGDLFFEETNIKLFEEITVFIFVVFTIIMTISMTNLLIGYATGDKLKQLIDKGKEQDFRSKVDLILQYSYMFPCLRKRLYETHVNRLIKVTFSKISLEKDNEKEDKDRQERKQIAAFFEKFKTKHRKFSNQFGIQHELREIKNSINQLDIKVQKLEGKSSEMRMMSPVNGGFAKLFESDKTKIFQKSISAETHAENVRHDMELTKRQMSVPTPQKEHGNDLSEFMRQIEKSIGQMKTETLKLAKMQQIIKAKQGDIQTRMQINQNLLKELIERNKLKLP